MTISRRAAIAGALATGAGVLGACSSTEGDASRASSGSASPSSPSSASPTTSPSGSPSGVLSATSGVADGSARPRGAQPGLPPITRLRPGETPPQFVVVSWDGAGNLPSDQLGRFRRAARRTGAHMTLFLSGIYFLPEDRRTDYRAPHHKPGESAISFFTRASVHRTIQGIGESWLEGHEIGTHFNGHFCGPQGVGTWSVQDWKDEVAQAKEFVTTWRTRTGFTDLPPLPFDYGHELVGSRTPCLEGYTNLRKAAVELGWRYDSSNSRKHVWPTRLAGGLWDLSMTFAPFPGHSFEAIPMDYTYMANQIGPNPKGGNPADRPRFQAQHKESLIAGVQRGLRTNRAPFVIGNHFEQWNGGIHMNAVEQAMDAFAAMPGVQMVPMRWLCDWMEAQDPLVLRKLQALGVGQAPPGGWKAYLDPHAPVARTATSTDVAPTPVPQGAAATAR